MMTDSASTLAKEFEVIDANRQYTQYYINKCELLQILLQDSRHCNLTFHDGCRIRRIVDKYPEFEQYCENSSFAMRYLSTNL